MIVLNIVIFLPLLTGLVALLLPRANGALIRRVALVGSALTLLGTLALWFGYDAAAGGLQARTTLPWIPAIGASYDIGVDGLSLPLIVLTALLTTLVMVYVLPERERVKEHAFLFLLMATGLLGVFAALDLLLFYLFFEIGLVPMYFIIGIWGGQQRTYAAIKFFLYTRVGSLAMLLSFLGLYLAMQPRTFSLPQIAAAQPLAAGTVAGTLVLLGMVLGFGVKLPIVPLHNWLPDAHVEAPTEGSVILAGLLLKMGGYGFLRIMLTTIPGPVQEYGWVLLVIGLISQVYGAFAALGQRDLKRLVAFTSINHMGYVMIAVSAWALTNDSGVRQLAINGAVFQMISHGLLTGGLFFMVGILQHQANTRDMERFGGLLGRVPVYSGLLGLMAFGSLGLPGLTGFIAEFQVIGAALDISVWAAVVTLLGLIVTTGLFIRMLVKLLMGEPPRDMPPVAPLDGRELVTVVPLAALAVLFGVLPSLLISVIDGAAQALAGR